MTPHGTWQIAHMYHEFFNLFIFLSKFLSSTERTMNKMALCSFLKKRIDDDRYPQLLETLLKEIGNNGKRDTWKFLFEQKIPLKYTRMVYHLICLELMKLDGKYVWEESPVIQTLLEYHRANATISHDVDFANVRYISDTMTTLISKENLESRRAWFQFYKESLILTATSPQYMMDRYKKLTDHMALSPATKSSFFEIMTSAAVSWSITNVLAVLDQNEDSDVTRKYLDYMNSSSTPVFFNQPSE